MSLKTRIERLEAEIGPSEEVVDIDLGNGAKIRIARAELRKILREINGAGIGPAPSASRRQLLASPLGRE
ncbi:hypothetical protein GCM10027431_21490 [Lysobacter rhizosphaerae]